MIDIELQKRILSTIILLPLVLFFIISGSFYFLFFILLCFFISFYEWNKMIKKIEHKFFGTFFLIISFYTFYKISFSHQWMLVLLICLSTDIGGYIFGKLFKGPKITKISPNKTFTGMFGSFFLSIISLKIFFDIYSFYIKSVNFELKVIFFALIISSVSQIGDIIVSYFKRMSKVKDTGKLIPGHGGLLDRIDGLIFAFPFSYILYLNDFFVFF